MRGLTLRDPAFVGGLRQNVVKIFDFNFSDESTVAVSNNEITQITNKGIVPWTLTKSFTGPQYVTGINGRKCADWGSAGHSNYLRSTDTTEVNVGEIWIVLSANLGLTFSGFCGLVTTTIDDNNPNEWYVTGESAQSRFEGGGKIDQAFVNGSATNTFTSILPAINSPCILRLKRSSGVLTLQNGVQIGNDRDNPNRGWGGLVGQVTGFSSVLGEADSAAYQNELAEYWNITLV